MSKIAIKLFCVMLLLVIIAVTFLWVVQVWLLEPYYLNLSITQLESSLTESIKEMDELSVNGLSELARDIKGDIMIYDQELNSVSIAGKYHSKGNNSPDKLKVDELREVATSRLKKVKVLTSKDRNNPYLLSLYLPVNKNGKNYAISISTSLSDIGKLRNMLRQQLIILSIILTCSASILAIFLSRNLINPIVKIEKAVCRLIKGDLSPSLKTTRNDELGQLSNSVDTLGEKLRSVEALRRELIANISHELRSPLALIRGYAELVRDVAWKDDVQREENLDVIITESERMSSMVTDILDYSQFQSGNVKIKMEWIDLKSVINDSVLKAQVCGNGNNIKINVEDKTGGVLINADFIKMHQVMNNLLNNAINHTKGDISIVIKKDGKSVLVEVINPGETIPEKDRKLIFERYYRVQHQGGHKHGTGLGLSIVSTILSAHKMPFGVKCPTGFVVFWFKVSEFKQK